MDEESGLTLGEVLLQAEDQGIDIQGLENGESVSFTAQVPAARAARASQSVTITQGSYYYYADYGLGSYVTAPFTVSFGNVTATAYCIQPSKSPVRGAELTRSQNWKETGNWQRCAITEQKPQDQLISLTIITPIFPPENGLS